MLNKISIQPLYKQLMDIITQQIKNGTYKPGEKIPPEPELADLYHVSRITVRRTVEELCTQGYLIKYQGYIDRERMIADKIHRLEAIRIKGKFDYNSLNSLSTEARQKLIKIDPETLAQASRIQGVSPSDINVLLVLLGR